MANSSIAVVLLDTDPYHAMTPLNKIALSQFSDADQTNNISQELSEKLHKLGPCQKLLTTNCNYDLSLLRDVVIGYKNSRIVPGKTTISETSFVFFNVDICDILYFYCGTIVSYSIKYNHYSLSLIL
ncbi:hypothetical protein P5673_018793 [Acropora cervicornis]|uniref:Uncharacterized protein n=1 Tax=Acropora cervicornis TaxID=6130 RepID=A0AAD9QC11_ACRCE|nr:hypothetical protein P5673_018793 [Acropora cervicornis]